MSIGMIGSIMMFGENFVTDNWLYCNGQGLPIAGQYNDLCKAIGTIYGGDGRNNFNIPDMRGRVAVGAGQALNYTPVGLGESSGQNDVTIDRLTEIPPHTHGLKHGHDLQAVNIHGNVEFPVNNLLAEEPLASTKNYYTGQGETRVPMAADAISENTSATQSAGGNGSHNNMQPLLGVYFMICWKGNLPAPG